MSQPPSSRFRLSHLVVLGFLPTSCAISAQTGCYPVPKPPWGHSGGPMLVDFGDRGDKLPSLSALVLPAVEWCCPPLPHVWGLLSVFFGFCFCFLYKSTWPSPHSPTRTAVNLSGCSASAVTLIKHGGPSPTWLSVFCMRTWVDRWVLHECQVEGPQGLVRQLPTGTRGANSPLRCN